MNLSEQLAVAQQLQHTYAALTDSKDATGAAALLKHAHLDFDGKVVSGEAEILAHYQQVWSAPEPHAHFITNARISHSEVKTFTAQFSYQRWAYPGDARLTTIGTYQTTFAMRDGDWIITEMIVRKLHHK